MTPSADDAAADDSLIRPSPFQSWYVVVVLMALMAMSLTDRYAVALLAEPISAELGLSDQSLGLLIGVGFAAVYSLAGIPLAHLVDRGKRIRILVAGVVIWSIATIASGFAHSIYELAIYRAGVAVGEAVLTPAAVSMIADLFTVKKRVTPMATFSAVSNVMTKGSFIAGAGLLALATTFADDLGLAPWRLTLVLAGIPALLLALLLAFTVKEPPRQGGVSVGTDQANTKAFIAHLRQYPQFYGGIYLGISSAIAVSLGAATWATTMLVRGYGYSVEAAGVTIGSIGVGAGMAAAFFWALCAGRLERRMPRKSFMLMLLTAIILTLPMALFASWTRTDIGFIIGMIGITFTLGAVHPLITLTIQQFGPSRMRARLIALALLSYNLVGFTVGPYLIPFIGERWRDDEFSLQAGLGGVALIVLPIAALSLAMALRSVYREGAAPPAQTE